MGGADIRTADASGVRPGAPSIRGHAVQFYGTDAFLIDAVTRFIGAGLESGEAALVITTGPHREAVEEQLRVRGVDVASAREQQRYFAPDAAATVSLILVDGWPDAARFQAVVGEVIARAAPAAPLVRAFGEMVALLWAEGRRDAAIRLEELWNGLASRRPFSLLCGYPMAAFGRDADTGPFLRVCGEHSEVIPAEDFPLEGPRNERLRVVAQLQQKARALETELGQRKEAETALAERTRTLQALVEASPVPIVVTNPDTTVRLWNPAAERIFGWSEREVLGRPLPIVPPERLAESAVLHDAVVRGESISGVAIRRRRRDGAAIDLLVSAAPLTDRAGIVRATVLLFEDMTARNRAEAARQKALRELTTLTAMGRVLSAELDLQRLLQALVDAATQLSGAHVGAFFYNATDGKGGYLTLAGAQRETVETFAALGQPGLFAATFTEQEVVRLEDVTRDPRCGGRAFPGRLAVQSYLAVPVRGRIGDVFGGLFLGHPEPGMFTDEAERVVVGLAAQAAIAIENARLYEAERNARANAEAESRAKDEFLAMLGHELRNPLAAVQNAIASARLDASRREAALEIAVRGADRLRRLVDELLDVARITQGRITLRTQQLPIAAVVQRAVETVRQLIDERGHRITLALPVDDLYVDGDATRLEQIVANLVSNAAKYTEPGGRIEVTAERERAEVVLRVRDNGVGIAAEMLPRVFDLFAQADRALDRAQGGLGIGLTVVKRLVELHAGRVVARSGGLGKGAEFVVRLPGVAPAREVAPPLPTGRQAEKA